MTFSMNVDTLKQALEDRGYDVSVEDGGERNGAAGEDGGGVVSGSLAEGSPRQVWIDRAGRVRYQVTRLADEGTTQTARGGRAFKVSQETHKVVNVWVELNTPDDLAAVLDDLEDLALHPPAPQAEPREASAPATPTAEEPERQPEATTDVAPPTADEHRDKAEKETTPAPAAPTPSALPAPVGAGATTKASRASRVRRSSRSGKQT